MAAWSDGYFTDIPYTAKFFGHLAPASIAFACLRQGIRPADIGRGATYLELGCGQGFGLNLLAAANSEMRFWGVDFNPVHIANAQRLAKAAGLTNVIFDDLSFEQILELPEDRIPKCDIVALHGVYSWVSPANRALIVRILDRHVRPGGLVSISYNTFPAWTSLMPLRRFVKSHFDRSTGDPSTRALAAFQAAQAMIDGGARDFANPRAVSMVKRALTSAPAYLIHEYMNDHFHPHYHADVARELEPARLAFAASASAAEDFPALAIPAKLQATIVEERDPLWRETLMDYANDRQFRRDVFVRGRSPLSTAEHAALLNQTRFSLIAPAAVVSLNFQIPLGTLAGDRATYGGVLQALSAGPRSYGELAALAPFQTAAEGELLKVLSLLIEVGAVAPADLGEGGIATAQAFNRAVLKTFTLQDKPSHLAVPSAGTGTRMDFMDLLAMSAASDPQPDFRAAARRGWQLLEASGSNLTIKDKRLNGAAEHEAALMEHFQTFAQIKLPTFRRLGMI